MGNRRLRLVEASWPLSASRLKRLLRQLSRQRFPAACHSGSIFPKPVKARIFFDDEQLVCPDI